VSRDLKFRVWSISSKKMFERNNNYYLSLDGDLFQNDCLDYQNKSSFVIMQYTGLKDRNGVEIYEGDILTMSPYQDEQYTVQVYWKYSALILDTPFSESHDWTPLGYYVSHFGEHTLEVVGNIYEHPHLLPKEEEPK